MTLATKRIPVTPETWKRLARLKEPDQSYDELQREMIEAYNRQELVRMAQQARRGEGKCVDLKDVA